MGTVRLLLRPPHVRSTLPYSSRFTGLDVTSGKVTVSGDGNAQISFTSRPDIARYLSYVLTHLPAEQLKDRSFTLAGDTKVRPFVYMLLFSIA